MGLKESGLRGSLRNVSVGIDAIPDSGDLHIRYSAKEIDASEDDTITTFDELVADENMDGEGTFRETGINGHPAVEVDNADQGSGSGNGFQTDLTSGISPPYHLFMAVNYPVTDAQTSDGITSVNSDGLVGAVRDGPDNELRWRGGDRDDIIFSHDVEPSIISIGVPSSGNTVIRVNGSQVGSDDVGVQNWDVMTWGRRYDTDATDADLGELLGYDTDKIGDESEFENYLSDEWSISLD